MAITVYSSHLLTSSASPFNSGTSVGEVIQHAFEDHVQTKRSGGFVLDWYPEGWDHPEGRPVVEASSGCVHNPESYVTKDCPECISEI